MKNEIVQLQTPSCHILTLLTIIPRSVASPHVGNHASAASQKSRAEVSPASTQGLLPIPSLGWSKSAQLNIMNMPLEDFQGSGFTGTTHYDSQRQRWGSSKRIDQRVHWGLRTRSMDLWEACCSLIGWRSRLFARGFSGLWRPGIELAMRASVNS